MFLWLGLGLVAEVVYPWVCKWQRPGKNSNSSPIIWGGCTLIFLLMTECTVCAGQDELNPSLSSPPLFPWLSPPRPLFQNRVSQGIVYSAGVGLSSIVFTFRGQHSLAKWSEVLFSLFPQWVFLSVLQERSSSGQLQQTLTSSGLLKCWHQQFSFKAAMPHSFFFSKILYFPFFPVVISVILHCKASCFSLDSPSPWCISLTAIPSK